MMMMMIMASSGTKTIRIMGGRNLERITLRREKLYPNAMEESAILLDVGKGAGFLRGPSFRTNAV